MKLAIMQPYLFPYIGYFQLIRAVDKFVVFDDVNFINKGWINRNNILINDTASLFTVPLKNASQNRLIKDIEIGEQHSWKNDLLKKIELAYKKAPCFNDFFPVVKEVILSNVTHISELAVLSLTAVTSYLGIKTEFGKTSSVYNNSQLKAQSRIIDICKQENVTIYINPIGGTGIYSKDFFREAGLQLNFLKTGSYSYKQYKNEFVPHLSIIDVLMFNSKKEANLLMDNYELV